MRSVFATTMKKNDESEARGKLKCVFPWSILHENPETTVVVLPRCTDFIGVPLHVRCETQRFVSWCRDYVHMVRRKNSMLRMSSVDTQEHVDPTLAKRQKDLFHGRRISLGCYVNHVRCIPRGICLRGTDMVKKNFVEELIGCGMSHVSGITIIDCRLGKFEPIELNGVGRSAMCLSMFLVKVQKFGWIGTQEFQ